MTMSASSTACNRLRENVPPTLKCRVSLRVSISGTGSLTEGWTTGAAAEIRSVTGAHLFLYAEFRYAEHARGCRHVVRRVQQAPGLHRTDLVQLGRAGEALRHHDRTAGREAAAGRRVPE